MLLAIVGVYGSAAYSLANLKHEIGVRMALGASYARIRAMMLRENLTPIAAGTAAGIAGVIASGRYLRHLRSECCSSRALDLRGGGCCSDVAPADAVRAE